MMQKTCFFLIINMSFISHHLTIFAAVPLHLGINDLFGIQFH